MQEGVGSLQTENFQGCVQAFKSMLTADAEMQPSKKIDDVDRSRH